MTSKEMDKIINESVAETIRTNADKFSAALSKDLSERKNNDEGFAILFSHTLKAAAQCGAIAAISTLCKLHALDIDKIQIPDQ